MTSSKRHTFSFEGGDQLTTIGATFFVSYLYHRHVDSDSRCALNPRKYVVCGKTVSQTSPPCMVAENCQ